MTSSQHVKRKGGGTLTTELHLLVQSRSSDSQWLENLNSAILRSWSNLLVWTSLQGKLIFSSLLFSWFLRWRKKYGRNYFLWSCKMNCFGRIAHFSLHYTINIIRMLSYFCYKRFISSMKKNGLNYFLTL